MIISFIFCFLTTYFFAYTLNAPKKSMLISSLIASLGYIIYYALAKNPSLIVFSFFVGALAIALLGETASRIIKMPATVFITPAIIPLVPGLGLYQTMLNLVNGDYNSAIKTGFDTLLAIGAMAVGIALASIIAKIYTQVCSKK